MKILLVDDERSFLEQAEMFLKKEEKNFVIDTTYSAKKAMKKLETNMYDAVISDYQMPEMDGLEFLEAIREEKEMDIPFIIFTGKGREKVAIKALNLGADRYIQKGGDPKSQYSVLAQAVKQEIKHFKDAREKKKVEAELSSLVKASEDPIYIVDKECNILFANNAELQKTEMEFDEIINSRFIESHPKDDAIEFRKKVEEVIKTGEPQTHEVKHEDDKKYYYRTLSPIKNPSTGEIDRIAVISKDITDRKEMEDYLKESEQKYRRLVETTGDLIFVHDERGNIKFVNKAGLIFSGYTEEEVLGKNIMEFIPEDELKVLLERKKKRIEEENKDRQHFETAFINKEGKRIDVDVQSTPIFEEEQFKGELVVARDITESEQRKEDLKKYQDIFEEVPEPVMLQDLEGNYVLLNRAVSDYAGTPKNELLGKDESVFMDESSYKKISKRKKEVLEKEEPIEYEVAVNHVDKGKREIKTKRFPFCDRNRKLIGTVAICRDITKRKNKERRRKTIEEKYKTLFDELSDALFLEGKEGNIIEVNEEACELLGYDRDELTDMSVDDLVPDDEDKLLPGEIDEATLNGKPLETVNLSKFGTKIPVEVRGKIIELEGEERLLVSLRDITERKEVIDKRDEYQKILSSTLEAVNSLLIVVDEDLKIAYCNWKDHEWVPEENREKRGYCYKELKNYDEPCDHCPPLKTFEDGETRFYEDKNPIDGSYKEISVVPIFDEDDEVKYVLENVRDVTEQKKRKEELKREKRRFEAIFENSPVGIALVDDGPEIIKTNEAFSEMLGYDKEELEGMNIEKITHQEDYERETEYVNKLKEGKLQNFQIEKRYLKKSGEVLWATLTTNIVRDEDGNYLFGLGIIQDITDRKKVEENLKEAQARMSTLLSTIPSYVYMKDEDLNFVTANETLCKMLGVTKEEIKGKNDYDFFPKENAEGYQSDDRKVVETGEPVIDRIEKVPESDGEVTWNLTNKRPIKDDEGNVIGLVGQTMDITERIKAEKELEKREKELRTVTSGSNDAIIMIDSKDRIQFWNEAAEDMFGYTEEEAKEKKANDMIAPDEYSEEYEYGLTEFRKTGEGRVLDNTVEVKAIKKDGNKIPVELSVSSLEMEDELHAVAVIRDITERKKAEEREEFLHSLLRHDVANKNRVVQGYLELLEEYDLTEEIEKLIKNSKKAVDKSINLIEKVRILKDAQKEETKEVDLPTIIRKTVNEERPMCEEAGMELKIECPEKKCKIKAGTLINNVFSNLIENSVRHSEGDLLEIHVDIREDEVICTFEDNGKGIPDKDKEDIFEKGYTTDEKRGTGLGLFLVKMLMDIYNGKIAVKKSELGGARFDIHLKRK